MTCLVSCSYYYLEAYMSTPHISAAAGDFAPTVLMPGDPLRAKFIANQFLSDVREVNQVRNMLAYTGTYQDQPVSVMGSGMGMPSMGIYAHELFTHYGVERIVRVGSCGAYTSALRLFDTLIVSSAWTESTFATLYAGHNTQTAYPSEPLNQRLLQAATALGDESPQLARVHSTDVFYRHPDDDFRAIYRDHGCVAVDMEAFALFIIAQHLGKEAACLLTVSDILETGEGATAAEREQAFTTMLTTALAAV